MLHKAVDLLRSETKNTQDLPPDMTAISRLGLSWAVFHTVVFALQQGLFEHLVRGPASREALSAQFSIPRRPMDVLLQVLASCELLQSSDGDVYELTPAAAAYLVQGQPGYIGYYLQRYGQMAQAMGDNIGHVFFEDRPLDKPIRFDDRVNAMDHETLERYCQGMAAWGYEAAVYLAAQFDFSPFQHLLDVGGGSGTFAIEIARRHPHLHISVFELPGVADIVNRRMAQLALDERVRGIGGNIFTDDLPSTADILLMSRFLDSWGDEELQMIINKCYQALRPGGTLLITETFLNDTKTGPQAATFWSLTLLMIVQGRHRSVAEYTAILSQAGFTDMQVQDLCSNQLLIAHKPI